jgi:hypothetical protein
MDSNPRALTIKVFSFADGSYLIDFSYWLPVADKKDEFELYKSSTIAPDEAGLVKVMASLAPLARHERVPSTARFRKIIRLVYD